MRISVSRYETHKNDAAVRNLRQANLNDLMMFFIGHTHVSIGHVKDPATGRISRILLSKTRRMQDQTEYLSIADAHAVPEDERAIANLYDLFYRTRNGRTKEEGKDRRAKLEDLLPMFRAAGGLHITPSRNPKTNELVRLGIEYGLSGGWYALLFFNPLTGQLEARGA